MEQGGAGQFGSVLGEGVKEPLEEAAEVGVAAVQVEDVAVRPLGANLVKLLFVAPPADDEPTDPVHPAAPHVHVHQRGALKHGRGHPATASPAAGGGRSAALRAAAAKL